MTTKYLDGRPVPIFYLKVTGGNALKAGARLWCFPVLFSNLFTYIFLHRTFLNPRSAPVDCESVCGNPKPQLATDLCGKYRWTPHYREKDGCECLVEYKCCPPKCPILDPQKCHNGKSAKRYIE